MLFGVSAGLGIKLVFARQHDHVAIGLFGAFVTTLQLLFSDATRDYGWIKRPNEAFTGATALDVMLGGQLTDLMRVRRYVDSQRSPW